MLELSHIAKSYTTDSFTQTALNDVSLAFRDCEFVSILGPSGSGKTTLLNVIGGLDHFDSGDLLIDGTSTKKYKDRDWDTYRNNRIGFVFQSYNLIPHQTALSNVELALTLSGVSKEERTQRAKEALAKVGLADHMDKKPSQLSGGQMQRVALARALVNNPEIVLADEPTGALDSQTSIRVMDLLKEVANDRLVVMVTHNPDLAQRYSTRIVRLADGEITADSDPFNPNAAPHRKARSPRKTSMSPLTALSLSFSNLMSKKGRTFLTAFAGSIGIIGIAAILALSSGARGYIHDVEEEMMTVYPLSVQATNVDVTSIMSEMNAGRDNKDSDEQPDTVAESESLHNMFQSVGKNDLKSLKSYLDADGGNINNYVRSIQYSYNVTPQFFATRSDGSYVQVNPETSFRQLGFGGSASSASMLSSTSAYHMLLDDTNLVKDKFDLVAGSWPTQEDELLVVLNQDGTLSDFDAYELGLRDHLELEGMVSLVVSEASGSENDKTKEDYEPDDNRVYSYEDILNAHVKMVYPSDMYTYDGTYNIWTDKSNDTDFMNNLIANGKDLHVAGIVKQADSATASALDPGLYYTSAVTHDIMDHAEQSDIVQQQLSDPERDVFSNRSFLEEASGQDAPDFDFTSLFTVDGTALQAAFHFDPSALNLDFSSLDFSNMQMPEVDVPKLDLSSIDLSQVMVPDVKVEDLNQEELQQLMPDLSDVDLSKVLSQIHVDIDQTQAQALMSQVMAEYQQYMSDHPDASPTDYFLSDQGQQTIRQGVERMVDLNDLETQVRDALAPEIDERLTNSLSQALRSQIAQQLTSQMVQQITAQITQSLTQTLEAAFASVMQQLSQSLQAQLTQELQQNAAKLSAGMAQAISVDPNQIRNAFKLNMDEQQINEILTSMLTQRSSTLEGNLQQLGYADEASPSKIDIYPGDFDDKQAVLNILNTYNDQQSDPTERVTYTDLVGTVMQSITRIINLVSYVLIAFVSISLVVSSIMIAVITYISVLERRKEIGILRSIGASKGNIRSIFNAETIIEGFVSGVMGIIITLIITIPVNAYVLATYKVRNVMRLSWSSALILIGISILLTFLAGLIPASKAAREDPVEALRSE